MIQIPGTDKSLPMTVAECGSLDCEECILNRSMHCDEYINERP